MFCTNCGNETIGKFCHECGTPNVSQSTSSQQSLADPQITATTPMSQEQARFDRSHPPLTGEALERARAKTAKKCPVCGSTDLQAISDVQGKGASGCKICMCGLLGLCGAGKTTTTHFWVCSHCGNKFNM